MPLYFESIIKAEREEIPKLCDAFWRQYIGQAGFPITSDGVHFHKNCIINMTKTGEKVGKIVYTLKKEDDLQRLLGCDVVFSGEPVELMFEYKLACSNEANEHYNVVFEEGGQHFQVETVDRWIFEAEDSLEGTTEKVCLTAFPFAVAVAKSMEELNKAIGFEPFKTELGEHAGFSEEFMGMNVHDDSETNPYTIMCGVVKGIQELSLKIGDEKYIFKKVDLKTGVGIIPVMINYEVFDLPGLEVGDYMFTKAHIKADFVM